MSYNIGKENYDSKDECHGTGLSGYGKGFIVQENCGAGGKISGRDSFDGWVAGGAGDIFLYYAEECWPCQTDQPGKWMKAAKMITVQEFFRNFFKAIPALKTGAFLEDFC